MRSRPIFRQLISTCSVSISSTQPGHGQSTTSILRDSRSILWDHRTSEQGTHQLEMFSGICANPFDITYVATKCHPTLADLAASFRPTPCHPSWSRRLSTSFVFVYGATCGATTCISRRTSISIAPINKNQTASTRHVRQCCSAGSWVQRILRGHL